jgi:hypothetical protein
MAHFFILQCLFFGFSLWHPAQLPFLYMPQLVQTSPQ